MKHNKPALTINLIGAGNLGKSLARLWHEHELLSVKQIFTTSQHTAQSAVDFVGAGTAHAQLVDIEPTDFILIAVPDGQIQAVSDSLHALTLDMQNTVIFHCSGAVSSVVLNKLIDRGASIASVHPIKSFANPESVVTSFEGTFCGVEGEQVALAALLPLFSGLGGKCVNIDAEKKALYHCAAVFTNNYLVSLVESAQRLYQLSGIDREQSMQLMAPMLRETCENVIKLGTLESLTGPIARGDNPTIEKHLSALKEVDPGLTDLYQSLGQVALRLKNSDDKSTVDSELYRLLNKKN